MKLCDDLQFALRSHAKRGGKTSRRRQIQRIEQFLQFCAAQGVRAPEQIGKRHVYAWYETGGAPATLRDRYYAVQLLWTLIGRGKPPAPTPVPAPDLARRF